jgi:hypothetical protein
MYYRPARPVVDEAALGRERLKTPDKRGNIFSLIKKYVTIYLLQMLIVA